MNIPSFLKYKWTENDGQLTDQASIYHDELNRAMQGALSDNGWTLPLITSTQLTALESTTETEMPDGTMWYITPLNPSSPVAGENEVVVKINGALRKLTNTAWP